jgi:hypothetical protein
MTKGIVYILANDATVKGLVGTKTTLTTEYKVYPIQVPQTETVPYIAVQMISRPPEECKSGRANSFRPSVVVRCYATNYEDALAIEDSVIDALDNKASGTYNGVILNSIKYADSSEDFINTDGNGIFVRSPVFNCYENESDPT